jgi:DNA-binding transcriptional ArsR family regulator
MADKGKGSGENGKRKSKRKKPKDARQRKLEASRERAKLIWAIAHPLRRRILRTLAESKESHSPTWLADTLNLPLSTTAYHVTILRKFGAVELADEQMARGAVEHFYLPTVEDDPPIESLLEETRDVDDEDTDDDKA